MKRIFQLFATAALIVSAVQAAPLTKEQKQETFDYVVGLHNEDKGFRATGEAGPSSLSATNAAVRAAKYLGGKRPGVDAFLYVCTDPSGGFVDAPGTAADVRTTAMGLMVAAELKNALAKDESFSIRDYFDKRAASIPDIYIAAAALDAAGIKGKKTAEWVKTYEATLNPDGTYGKTPLENAGAAITLLRLGAPVKNPAAVAKALQAAQTPDGGFAGMGSSGDLSATYRIVRALYMLKAKPDIARLREFIGKCRNEDGGYGPTPGKSSTLSATYNAAIVSYWLDEMEK
ncbi:MAG: putative beta-jelly-roll-type glycoside hydrolase and putative alpha/beta-hydrolase-type [Armatimonadetes bacterium]|jgi:hypothetical protein|nr:putative beta-jelly-roll-type glycoside hydrolase and putative alpha/beta-hydrolase-type [Armatimonadota bacterium]